MVPWLRLCILIQTLHFQLLVRDLRSHMPHVQKPKAEKKKKIQEQYCNMGFPVAQLVKNLAAVQETWVQSLGLGRSLEKKMATHSTILAWRIPMNRGAWWATVHGVTKFRHNLGTKQPPPV